MSAVRPGDINILTCMFFSPRGSYNMINSLVEGTIYESILVQNNICELHVLDTESVLDNLEVTGDETIVVAFNVGGLPTLSYTFSLDKAEILPSRVSEKAKEIVFHGVGREALTAKSTYIQKAYNTDIASIISDIHTTFLQSTSALLTEATNGIQKIIIPNLKPFDAIDMVRRRAVSSQNQSSTFLYFENAAGHNFKTIEGMMQQGVVKNFVHLDTASISILDESIDQIIDYELPQLFSSVKRIDLGGLVQRTATYDIRTRTYTSNDQTLTNTGKFPNSGNWNSSFFQEVFGQAFNLFSFIPADSASRPQTSIQNATPLQLAYISNLLQNYITLRVYGDTRVKAGDMINVNIPQSTITKDRSTDMAVSGNYLVSRIARHIDLPTTRPRYTEAIEGISGSNGF